MRAKQRSLAMRANQANNNSREKMMVELTPSPEQSYNDHATDKI